MKKKSILIINLLILLFLGCNPSGLNPDIPVQDDGIAVPIIYNPDPSFHNNNYFRVHSWKVQAFLYMDSQLIKVYSNLKGKISIVVFDDSGNKVYSHMYNGRRQDYFSFDAPEAKGNYTLEVLYSNKREIGSFVID